MDALIYFLLSIAFALLLMWVVSITIMVRNQEHMKREVHGLLVTWAKHWGEDPEVLRGHLMEVLRRLHSPNAEPPQSMGLDLGLWQIVAKLKGGL